ncbi:MAG: iron-sulfur cluster assembly scaffold protein [Promethearchaeota archaeon]
MRNGNKLEDFIKNAKNVGEIENPDGFGEARRSDFGDVIYMYVKIKENKIMEIKFEAFGCYVAFAVAQAISEMVNNMTLEQALKLTEIDLKNVLGCVPSNKNKCFSLGLESLKKAIKYYQNNDKIHFSRNKN